MIRRVLLSSAACAALWLPRQAHAQASADTVLLALPSASALTCESDHSAPPGRRAYFFGVGVPSMQMRTSSGQVLIAGPPPRELAAGFDTAGHPSALSDIVRLGLSRQVSASVAFDRDGRATGFRQSITTDTAAVMARVQREGLSALNAAIRENTHMGSAEPLDSLALRTAQTLARYLWGKRCP